MGDKLQFGKTYKAYRQDGDKIVEYECELAYISHYRAPKSGYTQHGVQFYLYQEGLVVGLAMLEGLNSRPTSLPTGYLIANFGHSKCGIVTFDKNMLGGDKND